MDLSNFESLKALDGLLAKIAEVLNVSIDAVQQNGMQYIMEYGRYIMIKNIMFAICIGFGLYIITLVAIWGVFALFDLFETEYGLKITISLSIASFVVIMATFILSEIIMYNASPLMYSIEQVMQLIN